MVVLEDCSIPPPEELEQAEDLSVAAFRGLQNAMTSSEERTSAEAEGHRIERALMDCVAPPSKGGDVIHQCPRADSRLLRRIFDHWPAWGVPATGQQGWSAASSLRR